MENTFKIIEFDKIIEQLQSHANTEQARRQAAELRPFLGETELRKNLRDTSEARQMLEETGTPPIPLMEHVEEYVDKAVRGDLLLPGEIEEIGSFLAAVKRLQEYLKRGRERQISLAYYSDNLVCGETLREEIERTIRAGRVDDYASNTLRDIRREIRSLEEKIKQKAESTLKANKSCTSDSFVVTRNGRTCIPVKKECKARVPGTVIDKSATGATLFIEPRVVTELTNDLDFYRIEEDTEERRILYLLMEEIASRESEMRENIRVIVMLDFVFAKGKMSLEMGAVEPSVNLERRIRLKEARHPLLERETCVPIDFTAGDGIRGVVITGPNTGGKTVAIKTVALLSAMACSGLHVPCRDADIAMNSQILCDIGDGQNLADNLSTFSAHMTNVIGILGRVNEESLVVMDELGSGTDPAEGMGIAIAILEQLRKSRCLFLVTTHYPEVKEYAGRHREIVNARMAFDRESLKPLYRLEIGKSGDSCALYIAKRLGIPNYMLKEAAREAYGSQADTLIQALELEKEEGEIHRVASPRIRKREITRREAQHGTGFTRGDSVVVMPEGKIGIVVKPADSQGNLLVQIQGEKIRVNHRRLKLKVAAAELYPEDYDFSILFDTVENRKKRHKMEKGYQKEMVIHLNDDV